MKKHPYSEYETTKIFKETNKLLKDLKRNKDIEIMTPIEYIAGYLVKNLTNKKLVIEDQLDDEKK